MCILRLDSSWNHIEKDRRAASPARHRRIPVPSCKERDENDDVPACVISSFRKMGSVGLAASSRPPWGQDREKNVDLAIHHDDWTTPVSSPSTPKLGLWSILKRDSGLQDDAVRSSSSASDELPPKSAHEDGTCQSYTSSSFSTYTHVIRPDRTGPCLPKPGLLSGPRREFPVPFLNLLSRRNLYSLAGFPALR